MSYEAELAAERAGRQAAEAEVRQLRTQLAETQRRSTEETQLADSLRSLARGRGQFIQNLAQAVPTALYIRYLNGRRADVYLNERLPLLLGYSSTELASGPATPLATRRHPADAGTAAQHNERLAAASDEATFETEFRLQTQDGEWKWFRSVETVLARDANGAVLQVLGSAEDISVQRAAAVRLAGQKEFYEAILQSLPADIAVFDPDHRLLADFRPGAARTLAYGAANPTETDHGRKLGLPSSVLRQRRLKFREALRRKSQVRWEEVLPGSSDTGAAHFLRHHHPVLDASGAVRFVIGYGLDITQLKQTETQLENQREFVRQVIENSPNPVHVQNEQGEVILANAAFTELGTTAGHLTSPPVDVMDATTPQITEELQELADGRSVWYQTIRKPFEQPGGSRYLLTISSDITALKQARAAAEASARSRELFVASTSHEIRTPLHGISGLAQLLRKTPLSDAQAEFVDLILSSTQSLVFVVNDILDFAKAESGNLSLESIPFDVARTVEETTNMLGFRAAEKGLPLHVNLGAAQGLVVEGDPYRLRQVLVNLVGNAIKFTSRGRVEVKVEAVQPAGELTYLTFSVRDSGIGISPDRFEHIFKTFGQAATSTTRLYGGSGLGLTICKNLVELQGGQIGVESKEGVGSRFYVTIPYRTSTRAVAPAPPEPVAFPALNKSVLRGLRVLLAEDNPLNQLIALTLLDSWQVEVDVVSNGEEALRMAATTAYDLILMDLQMPVLGGLEATVRLRAHAGPNQRTPVIALTANGMKSDLDQYPAAGFTSYLIKPYLEADLYQALAQLAAPVAEPLPLTSRVSTRLTIGEANPTGITLPVVTSCAAPYDFGGLGKLAHNAEFVRQMKQLFVDQVPDQMLELQLAVASHDYGTTAALAHSLRSTFGSIGIQCGASSLAQLEKLADEHGALDQLTPLLAVVMKAAATVAALFTRELAELNEE